MTTTTAQSYLRSKILSLETEIANDEAQAGHLLQQWYSQIHLVVAIKHSLTRERRKLAASEYKKRYAATHRRVTKQKEEKEEGGVTP